MVTAPCEAEATAARYLAKTPRAGAMGGIGGQIEGLDAEKSCFAMGQSAGGIHEVLPAGVIVEQLVAEARAAISRIAALNR